MNIIETIQKRKSCRNFNPVSLQPEHLKILEDYIGGIEGLPGNETIQLRIVEMKEEGKTLKLNYGMIKGHNTFLLGITGTSAEARQNYGYLCEKVVLKATAMGIASCWIGYFDPSFFGEIEVGRGYEIPSIVILGYSGEKETTPEKLMRFAVRGSKRIDWDKLFFNYHSHKSLDPVSVREYTEPLEMLRLAPSAGNTQPWRVFYDDETREFHFFKKPVSESYERRGLHDIDMGIALSHFEMTSVFKNLKGDWLKYPEDKITSASDKQYIITWKCK